MDLISEIAEMLIQSEATPRGRLLRRWLAGTLAREYQVAAAGIAPPGLIGLFPDYWQLRLEPQVPAGPAETIGPACRAGLAKAVRVMRQAGFLTGSHFSDTDLALAARATWLAYEHDDIPLDPPEQMYWRLLVMDARRTWSEDVDAGVRPDDAMHGIMLLAVSKIMAPGSGQIADPDERYAPDGDVLLTFTWRRRPHQLLLPAPGACLSPALITGLNELAPPGRPRLWFAGYDPPRAIVSRATAEERDTLEHLTGLRLDAGPPSWWTALAPLPGQAVPGPEPATPARPAHRAPAPGPARPTGTAPPSERAVPAAGMPEDGEITVGPVALPAGRRVWNQAGQAVAWATSTPVPRPGRLWSQLSDLHRQTRLVPFLLAGLDRTAARPWDSGEFDAPGDVTELDRVDVADVLAAGWDARGPGDDDKEADPDAASTQAAPFTWFPGLAPAEHVRLPNAEIRQALDALPAARLGMISASRPAEALPLLGSTASDQFPDPTPLAAVLASWEDRYSASLPEIGYSQIRLLVRRPARDPDTARRLAAEHYAFSDESGEDAPPSPASPPP